MFGGSTNPFGQASSSPFGTQNVFGQANNSATSNPFAPKPFGSSSPFGVQTGSSMFGGTSTGMFGAPQASSPFGSTTTFGASSSPAFGNSSPAFGATSTTPAFGASSSAFGGSSAFGQKPAFGGFGSTAPANPFGNTSQPTQPAFGSSLFGTSNPFGAQSQPAFGASSSPAFGAVSSPSFGVGSSPSFGSSPSAFGATSSSAFGSTTFGSTGSGFGTSNTPLFGSGSAFGASTSSVFGSTPTPAFGASSAPAFGASTTSAFGSSTTPAFGTPSNTTFGASTSSFNFSSSPAFGQAANTFGQATNTFGQSTNTFGQTASTFGGSPFGSTTSSFGTQSSTFGTQSAAPFGSPGFGQTGQRGGSRVASYTPTNEPDGTGQPGKLESISAMPIYKEKSHEELRWEDYQLGDKGGPAPPTQSSGGLGFNVSPQTSAFATSTPFSQTSSPFSTNAFSLNKSPNPFSSSTPFMSSLPSFSSSASLVGTGSTSGFGTTPSFFSSLAPNTSASNFSLNINSAQTPVPASTPSFAPSNIFSTGTTGSGGFLSNTSSFAPSQTAGGFSQPAQSMPSFFQPSSTPSFNISNISQTPTGFASGFTGLSGSALSTPGMMPSTQSSIGMLQMPVTNPFGTLPPMPQISIGQAGNAANVEYGISSRQVADKPPPVRISSLLTSRHFSQRRIRLPTRRYHPNNDSSRLSMYGEEDEMPSTPKADAFFIPRENPRALIINHSDYLLPFSGDKTTKGKGANGHANQFEETPIAETDTTPNQKQNHVSNGTMKVLAKEAEVKSSLPKIKSSDYYTKPELPEMEAKERIEPGFCSRVKDFVVGRRGYGSIKFLGETDVRGIDLESVVQFNDREVIVYMDDREKPPVGEGLNKAAEVTLLRIKCFDKKTGREFTEGPKVERYRATLVRKTEEQGAEFVSYDPAKGEWKFKVKHFSKYSFGDEITDV